MINIYIANLGKYNEGVLVGKWLQLPYLQGELNDLFVEIGLGKYVNGKYVHGIEKNGQTYEEYAIHDYEADLEITINEFDSIAKLNELAELLADLDEHELKKADALLEWNVCNSYLEAVESLDNYTLLEGVDSEEKLGDYWLLESGCYEIPDFLVNYLDTEAFGRDMSLNENGYFSKYGWISE
ncbi:antirestriction protein ArdA [Clostridium sp. CS001]|uniref:antirestriction protein ArdA n=1 Tax=Clostridium sp. CS001 TaxID=2880648 RepID=UPI001CF50D55|nr:antirestriction protein ArdA [Clostridium sp. CS001]MCB2289760.1 antirestriction protein ArdA [Clostridium sp. CS001]